MRARDGFTLVELVIVALLGAVLLSAVGSVWVWQMKASRQAQAASNTQQTLRTALSLLQQELRETSPSMGDLTVAKPESVSFRAFRNVGIVCLADPSSAAGAITLDEVGSSDILAGDSVSVFADIDSTITTDDTWRADSVRTQDGSNNCTGVAQTAGTASRRTIYINPATTASGVYRGAPVRSFERLTYGIFYVNSQYVLGRRGRSGAVDVLLGPLETPANHGLYLAYFDTLNNQVSAVSLATVGGRASIRRIRITVKGKATSTPSSTNVAYVDSLVSDVYLRGN